MERIFPETSAELSHAVFSETDGIAYSPRWLGLKRAAGCSRDNLPIGSDFHAFPKKQGIRRDAANIEQGFSDCCRKLGKA